MLTMIFPLLISPELDGRVYIRGESREMPWGQWRGGGEVTVLER